jgi:hypothetical protein
MAVGMMQPLFQGRSEVVRLPQLRSDFLLETSGPITRAAKNTEIKVFFHKIYNEHPGNQITSLIICTVKKG